MRQVFAERHQNGIAKIPLPMPGLILQSHNSRPFLSLYACGIDLFGCMMRTDSKSLKTAMPLYRMFEVVIQASVDKKDATIRLQSVSSPSVHTLWIPCWHHRPGCMAELSVYIHDILKGTPVAMRSMVSFATIGLNACLSVTYVPLTRNKRHTRCNEKLDQS